MTIVLSNYGVVARSPGQWMVYDAPSLALAMDAIDTLRTDTSLRVRGAAIQLQRGEKPVRLWRYDGQQWTEIGMYVGDTEDDLRVRRNLARAVLTRILADPTEAEVCATMAQIHPGTIERLRQGSPAVYARLCTEAVVLPDAVSALREFSAMEVVLH